MQDNIETCAPYRILHAVVGYKFPVYFTNAVNSVLQMTADDDVLVVDNASQEPELTRELQLIADKEPRVSLMLRDNNDIPRNKKVGGLYDAYNEVIAHALREGYDYLNLMQHDSQLLWWDESVLRRAQEIYAEYPECVNICMHTLPRYGLLLAGNLEYVKPNLARLRNYGLTDTGLYDLNRWREHDMRFLEHEKAHAKKYLDEGLSVFFHPLPVVGFIPWPAVVRGGRVKGRELRSPYRFLLKPLTADQITQVKEATEPIPLEDLAVPWGWASLTPYWLTDVRAIDYWVFAYRDIRSRGLRAALPRWERRGLSAGETLRQAQRRPRFGLLPAVAQPVWYGLRKRLAR